MPSSGMGDGSSTALNASGIDLSNDTQAMDFLGEILDDTQLQIAGNAFARYFWYGTVVLIGIAAMINVIQKLLLHLRFVVRSWVMIGSYRLTMVLLVG